MIYLRQSEPKIEMGISLVWEKYQVFFKAAENDQCVFGIVIYTI